MCRESRFNRSYKLKIAKAKSIERGWLSGV